MGLMICKIHGKQGRLDVSMRVKECMNEQIEASPVVLLTLQSEEVEFASWILKEEISDFENALSARVDENFHIRADEDEKVDVFLDMTTTVCPSCFLEYFKMRKVD